jgi:flagellar assembly protein FliH
MISSNYFKQSYIQSPLNGAPENYFIPNIDDDGLYIVTESGITGVDDPENSQLKRKETSDILLRARADALKIIGEAKEKAQALLDQAVSDSEIICSEKYNAALEKGYKEGLKMGEKAAQNEVGNILRELGALSDSLENEKLGLVESSQQLILDIAAEIALKVAGESFVRDEKVFLSLFKRAVKEIPPAQKLVVTISDKDYRLMSYDPQKLLALNEGFSSIELCCDKSAKEGTLGVETAVMLLDAGINTQIGLLKKEITSTF